LRNIEIPIEIADTKRQLGDATMLFDRLNQEEAAKKETEKRKVADKARAGAREERKQAETVAWAATREPWNAIADAKNEIKALQDANKTAGDKATIEENYQKISKLRDTVASKTKEYNALKKTAEDLKTANMKAQADEDKQVEQ